MKLSLKTGISFGLTSGIITTLGLIVGLHAGTQSKIAVMGGIVTIAVADAFSDALGIHISQEAQNKFSITSIWESTLATFGSKLLFALTFIVPMTLLPLNLAIIISIVWGLLILGIFSYIMARQHRHPWSVVSEHLIIALIVIFITHYLGDWIRHVFG